MRKYDEYAEYAECLNIWAKFVLTVRSSKLLPRMLKEALNTIIHHPPYKSSEESKKLHSKLFIIDMHADSLLHGRNLLKRHFRGHVDIPRLIQGNVALQMFTVVTKAPMYANMDSNEVSKDAVKLNAILCRWPKKAWDSLLERALFQAEKLALLSQNSNGNLTFIKYAEDLENYITKRINNKNITAGLLGLEGAHALEGNIKNVNVLYDAGFRMISPTHFFDNELGGSAHGIRKLGLSDFGAQVIKRMDELEILIDLAHASSTMIDDVLKITKRPVIVSHTGVKGVCDNNRNLDDMQIKNIANAGGVICIGYWDTATGGKDAGSIARSIRHVSNLVGVEHVGLGSDFDGAVIQPFDVSGMVLITEALMKEGFIEDEIEQIMGGNVLRLLRNVLPKKEKKCVGSLVK